MSRKALGNNFFIIDNKCILHFDSEVYRKWYPVIDFESFAIIKSNGSTFHYFRDRHHIYLDSYMNMFAILPEADPADFRILDFNSGKATSKDNDYLFDQKLPHRFGDYEILSAYYQLVGNTVYFNYYNEMPGADAASFDILFPGSTLNVAKDKNHVYFRDKIVPGADAATFRFLDECLSGAYYRECDHTYYAKDKNNAYYIDTIAPAFKIIKTKSTDQFHFKVINETGYAFDAKYKYLFGKRSSIDSL